MDDQRVRLTDERVFIRVGLNIESTYTECIPYASLHLSLLSGQILSFKHSILDSDKSMNQLQFLLALGLRGSPGG